MSFQKNESNNLSDEESIVNYMNFIFFKSKYPSSPTSIKTYIKQIKLI